MKLLGLLLFISHLAFAAQAPLLDVDYSFDQTKVEASADVFHFLRSFVDYYYKLVAQNSNSLHAIKKAGNAHGLCVGDAHAENFGILLQENGSALFTNNDMDDSGPCPVVLDILRLLVSSRLYAPDLDIKKVVHAYQDGLLGHSMAIPDAIKSMTKDALKKGFPAKAKNLQGRAFLRVAGMNEVDPTTRDFISRVLQNQFSNEHLSVLDIVSTSKVGGGSGGLLRYEVLVTNNSQSLIHLELKQLVTPAIYPVATEVIPDQSTRLKRVLQMDQGTNFSHYYSVLNIKGLDMLLRPKFAGNVGFSLTDFSLSDNKEVINFEAYILGLLHAKTVQAKDYNALIDDISFDKWEEDIKALGDVFNHRFSTSSR